MTEHELPPEVLEALRDFIARPEGVAFFQWLLLQVCGLMTSPFTNDERVTNFVCGKQAVGYEVLPLLGELNPTLFAKMMETS